MSRLGSLVSADLAETHRLLLVPLGATEQHGPHLPLGTDTEIAVVLANRAATHVADVVVAPAIPYGSSGEHQDFPGTVSIGQDAMELVLVELVRSATATFSRILLLTAHGGNAAPVTRAVRRLREEGRDALAWNPASAWSGDAHAGLIETSIMLALRPETVDITRAASGNLRPLRDLLPELARAGVASVSPNGVLGDPSGASMEQGQTLLAQAVDSLTAFIAQWPAPTAAR